MQCFQWFSKQNFYNFLSGVSKIRQIVSEIRPHREYESMKMIFVMLNCQYLGNQWSDFQRWKLKIENFSDVIVLTKIIQFLKIPDRNFLIISNIHFKQCFYSQMFLKIKKKEKKLNCIKEAINWKRPILSKILSVAKSTLLQKWGFDFQILVYFQKFLSSKIDFAP